MNKKNIKAILKNRYRLSAKVQMGFELSFPETLIGKSRFAVHDGYEDRTQKVSPSMKGLVVSDTMPLSWFTSSLLIPWDKMVKIHIYDSLQSMPSPPLLSRLDQENFDFGYCRIEILDPREMTIDLPWSEKFTDYVEKNKLMDL